MARHSTVALTHVHAERARHIARHLKIPVGALLATFIDQAFENEFDIRPSSITQLGADLQIELGESFVVIPAASATSVAGTLRGLAGGRDREACSIDMDVPAMLAISRNGGRGLTVETLVGKRVRYTMGISEALRLADDLDRHALA